MSLTDEEGNLGLDSFAPQFIEESKKKGMSNADIIQLAAVVSVKHCGGPDIPFVGGRKDNKNPNPVVVDRLPGPNEDYEDVKEKFRRQGITEKEMAVLVIGGHSMGGIEEDFFDDTPGVFDNLVFQKALDGDCVLDIDCDIADDPDLRPLVQKYARDEKAFFEDFSKAFAKLTRQGTGEFTKEKKLKIPQHSNLKKEGVVENAKPSRPIDSNDNGGGGLLGGGGGIISRISSIRGNIRDRIIGGIFGGRGRN
jgi:L-ascorbate peroxidase